MYYCGRPRMCIVCMLYSRLRGVEFRLGREMTTVVKELELENWTEKD
jgi:hypothetical protein